MKRTHTIAALVALIVLVAAGTYAYLHLKNTPVAGSAAMEFSCTQGPFTAVFTEGQVALTFPNGRMLSLPQVTSGSGVRYEKDGVVFVSKGDDAFITENDATTFSDCVANGADSTVDAGTGMKTFSDTGNTFRFSYLNDFTVTGSNDGYTTDWMNNATQTGLVLARVTIPKTFQPNTNFSEARFNIGTSADPEAVKTCLTEATGGTVEKSAVTINGVQYAKIVAGDAGAGNFYDTTSYRTVHNGQCYVVEYTIHSTNIANYPAEQGIREFDKASVQSLLEGMAQSFMFI